MCNILYVTTGSMYTNIHNSRFNVQKYTRVTVLSVYTYKRESRLNMY